MYHAKLTGLTPSQSLIYAYRALPLEFDSNAVKFYIFVRKYGTHFVTGINFGQQLHILLDQAGQQHAEVLNPFAEEIMNFELRRRRKNVFIIDNGQNYSSLDEFRDSAYQNPEPYSASLLPLFKLLDPEQSSTKTKSLEKITKFFVQSTKLKAILQTIEMMNNKSPLHEFLRSELRHEVEYVCPRQDLADMVEKSIINDQNFHLERYFLSYMHDREYSEEYEQDIIAQRVYYLLPSICFTPNAQLETCKSPMWAIPPSFHGIRFFEGNNCQGSSVVVDDLSKIHFGMTYWASFTFA